MTAAKRKAAPARARVSPEQRALAELRQCLREVSDLRRANAVLGWDQSTYMPTGGAEARGRQRALLSRLAHERFTAPRIGRLLDKLEAHASALPADSDDSRLVRVTRREYEIALKVPAALVARFSAHSASTYQAWTVARPANDFASLQAPLEVGLDLSREYAGYFAPFAHIIDPMIDQMDEGLTAAEVARLFAKLRKELVPMVRAITAAPPADDSCLRQQFPEGPQLAFSLEVARDIGYDLERGRLDKTHHPFCTNFAPGDVRITTRVREDDLGDAFFSTVHEAGHALYEQGVAPELEGTPLCTGVSMGVHESQSRLWENIVGRSRGFWQQYYPRLQRHFPDQLGAVPLETFYRAINKVQRSLIRTDADEVTYNLHVMLRFDLEMALLEGKLAVKDLPEAWRARYEADLGVSPLDDRDGVLQDVHWFSGGVGGAFHGYTIGNILSAQFFEAAVRAQPAIAGDVARGEFAALRGWLTANLYRHGAKYPPAELIARVTGGPLRIEPYIAYLHGKYGEIYDLPARRHELTEKAS
jgi:carboxypeptidase Taq